MGGSVEKQIQKTLGSLSPCGNRCRFSESAICSSQVHPPSEIKSNFKFTTLRWRLLRWRLTLSEFTQPRLSRVIRRSSPARGYKFGCVCSYMAGHYPGILMTGHIWTNTPKFVPPRRGRPPFDPTQTGLCKFNSVVGLELADLLRQRLCKGKIAMAG